MPHNVLVCESCHAALPVTSANALSPTLCRHCNTSMTVGIFPAAFRAAETRQDSGALVDSADASCFVHDERRAVVSCGSCGKFLCDLCDVALLGQHFCTNCLEAMEASPNRNSRLHSEYRRWEVLALWVTAACLLMPVFLFLLSPAALVLAVMGWRAPRGPVGHPRRRAGALIIFHVLLTGLTGSMVLLGILNLAGVLD